MFAWHFIIILHANYHLGTVDPGEQAFAHFNILYNESSIVTMYTTMRYLQVLMALNVTPFACYQQIRYYSEHLNHYRWESTSDLHIYMDTVSSMWPWFGSRSRSLYQTNKVYSNFRNIVYTCNNPLYSVVLVRHAQRNYQNGLALKWLFCELI